MNIDANEIYTQAIVTYGEKAQAVACAEELSELSQIMCKFANGKNYSVADLIDELADVEIMTDQIKLMFSHHEQKFYSRIAERKKTKLLKLKQRMDEIKL